MKRDETHRGKHFSRCQAAARWILAAGVVLVGFAGGGRAGVLWQLGIEDGSSGEFRPWIDPTTGARLDYSDPASDPRFLVGKSTPARDWFAYQPGTANGGAGFRPHPATVTFVLDRPVLETARLRLSLLAYSARLPLVEVEVNGRRGRFYQRTTLDLRAGDPAVFFIPYYSSATVEARVPGGWLVAGTNRITLTAVDEPGDRDDTRPSGFPWPGSSGIHYDALRLETIDAVGDTGDAGGLGVRVVPTVFYRRHGGGLEERVTVDVSSAESMDGARVVLRMEGFEREVRIATSRSFGEERIEFWVPEFSGTRDAEVRVMHRGAVRTHRAQVTAGRRWTLRVVPNAHLDIGYTDHPAKVAELQSRMLDRAIEWSGTDPNFRFTPDGFWCVEAFQRGRGAEAVSMLIDRVRNRRIELPVVHSSLFTGFASVENMIRHLFPSWRFSRAHGTPFEIALQTDVPNSSWSWASVLAASGVRGFVLASDAYRAPFLLRNRFHEHSPHWWEGPDGRRVLTWHSRHYHQLASLFGLPAGMANGRDSIPRFLEIYDRPGYRSDSVLVYGSQVENSDLHPAQADLAGRWNREFAFPRIEYSTFAEALDRITRDSGPDLPVFRGDGGPYWEDGLGANARTTALARANMRRVLSAEILSATASLLQSRVVVEEERLEGAWEAMRLTDEHTWHADCSVREPLAHQTRIQGELKDGHAVQAQRDIEHVIARSLGILADAIPAAPGSLVVFNPLSWERSGWVESDLAHGLELVELASGRACETETVITGNAFRRVRFLAQAVPAVGYKVFGSRPARPAPPTGTDGSARNLASQALVLTNDVYQVEFDRESGAVHRWIDRETGMELSGPANPHGVALGDVVYVTGGDALPNRLVQFSTVDPVPRLEMSVAKGRGGMHVRRGAGGWRAVRIDSLPQLPRIETEYFLPDQGRRLELTVRMTKVETWRKEGVYVAFPVSTSLRSPRLRYATATGWVDPSKDLLRGASLEWFAVQGWAALEGEKGCVCVSPVEAPLITWGDIARGRWPETASSDREPVLFSYVMNNYTPEGYQAGQGGVFVFRYVLTNQRTLDPVAAYRDGMAAQTPLEVNEVTRNDKAFQRTTHLPADRHSFVQLRPETVSLSTFKRADAGGGHVARIINLTSEPVRATLEFAAGPVARAWRATPLEHPLAPLESPGGRTEVPLQGHAFETVTLTFGPADTRPAGP